MAVCDTIATMYFKPPHHRCRTDKSLIYCFSLLVRLIVYLEQGLFQHNHFVYSITCAKLSDDIEIIARYFLTSLSH